jgi:formylglycine-generating enzyme required for sulfatase activity
LNSNFKTKDNNFMKTVSQFLFGVLLLALGFSANANNLTITNVSLTGATSTTIQVQYNMFWDNSWRDLENWDAAWVFVKYSTNAGLNWSHATLSATGHVGGTATPTPTIHIPQDNMGAFIYRSATGSGTYTITSQQLQWNFTANGLNQTQASGATIRVFGMEMVYIPQGEYYLGDGVDYTNTPSPTANAFRRTGTNNSAGFVPPSISETLNDPYYGDFRINGLLGIDLNNDTVVSTWPTDAPDFPTGYKAFYCMKYKVTQGQYTDFLNTLTYDQQTQRGNSGTNSVNASFYNGSTTALPSHRNNIFVLTPGVSNTLPRVLTATRPDRECNYINWPDAAAYLDWATLRPYTEFEKEKLSRGPVPPVLNETANGTTSFTTIAGISLSVENGTEAATNTTNNLYNISQDYYPSGGDNGNFYRAPIRSGIFGKSNTTRTQSGATYYGVMDVGSGLIEWQVHFASLAGRSFTGLHGNGVLNTNAQADVNFWPGINGNSSTGTANTTYSGSTGVTNGAGIVFTGFMNYNATIYSAAWGPWLGTSYHNNSYPYFVSARMTPSYLNVSTISTSTGRQTSYTTRYQTMGFRGVKSNL